MTKLLALTALLCGAAVPWPATAAITTSTEYFTSGGTSIQVDVTLPGTSGLHPSVIFLYGADGMALFPWNYETIANWFASQGYNFFVVHYFDRTGTVLATPLITYSAFDDWIQVVNDAATWVSSRPGADPRKLALMGM